MDDIGHDQDHVMVGTERNEDITTMTSSLLIAILSIEDWKIEIKTYQSMIDHHDQDHVGRIGEKNAMIVSSTILSQPGQGRDHVMIDVRAIKLRKNTAAQGEDITILSEKC